QCASPDLPFEPLVHSSQKVDDYTNGLRDTLTLAWDTISGASWTNKTVRYNQRPRKPLRFHSYKVDQLVFIKRIPRRFYKDPKDEVEYHQSSKFQARYAGPYRITRQISDVLYEAQI